MNQHRPARPKQNSPAFLARIRANSQARLPRWLDWHFALILAALVVMGGLLSVLSPILAPFLAAAILAYIFDPLVDRLAARGVPRAIGAAMAVLLVLVAMLLLMLIVLPLFTQEMVQLAQLIPGFVEHLKTNVMPWVNTRLGTDITLDATTIRQFMQDHAADAGGIARRVFATVGSGGLAVLALLVNLALIPVVFFYVLRDWDVLVGQVDALVPRRYHNMVAGVAREIDAVLAEFLRGQLLVMAVMATFYVVGLWAVGLKFALPVGLITGLLVFVPYLGVGTGVVLGTIAAMMQPEASLAGLGMVWAVFAVGQVIEGFAVTPKFVGDRIGLHPVAVIFALLAFGQLFGFFGVLMALPASAAILVGLRHVRANYRQSEVFRR